VGDKVANTIGRGVRDVLDVFSLQHSPKGGQQEEQRTMDATSGRPAPLHLQQESMAYWQCNQDKLVRVQLLIAPGPWAGSGSDLDASRHRNRIRDATLEPPQLQDVVNSFPMGVIGPVSGVALAAMDCCTATPPGIAVTALSDSKPGTNTAGPSLVTSAAQPVPGPAAAGAVPGPASGKPDGNPRLLPAEISPPGALAIHKPGFGQGISDAVFSQLFIPDGGNLALPSVMSQQGAAASPAAADGVQTITGSSADFHPGRRSIFEILKASVAQRFHDPVKVCMKVA
jgi:hypothetical protein